MMLFPFPPFGQGRCRTSTLIYNKTEDSLVVQVDSYGYGLELYPFYTQLYPYQGLLFDCYLPLEKQSPNIDKLLYAYIHEIQGPEAISFSPGPLGIGEIGNGTYTDLFSTPWALVYYRNSGINLYQAWDYMENRPWRPGDASGGWKPVGPSIVNDFLPSTLFSISLMFDTAAREVAAFHTYEGIFVTRWDPEQGGFVSSGPFEGERPMLLNTAMVHYATEDSDNILFYIRTDSGSTTIYYRLQSENYSIERALVNLGRASLPLYILLLPYEFAILGKYLDDPTDSLVSLYYSPIYPVKLKDKISSSTISIPSSGGYVRAVLDSNLGLDEVSTTYIQAPPNGRYIDLVFTLDLGSDTVSYSELVPPGIGLYSGLVIIQDLGLESVGSSHLSSPSTGKYYQVTLEMDLSSNPYSLETLGQTSISSPNYGYYFLDADSGTNLAMGKTYTKSVEPDPSYPDSGGIEFTDGQVSSSFSDGKSFGYKYVQFGLPSSGGLASLEITVDLGDLYEVSGAKLVSGAGNSSYKYYADSVEILVSTDGSEWATVGSQNNTSQSTVISIPTPPTVARYVKFLIKKNLAPYGQLGDWLFIDEGEVYAY